MEKSPVGVAVGLFPFRMDQRTGPRRPDRGRQDPRGGQPDQLRLRPPRRRALPALEGAEYPRRGNLPGRICPGYRTETRLGDAAGRDAHLGNERDGSAAGAAEALQPGGSVRSGTLLLAGRRRTHPRLPRYAFGKLQHPWNGARCGYGRFGLPHQRSFPMRTLRPGSRSGGTRRRRPEKHRPGRQLRGELPHPQFQPDRDAISRGRGHERPGQPRIGLRDLPIGHDGHPDAGQRPDGGMQQHPPRLHGYRRQRRPLLWAQSNPSGQCDPLELCPRHRCAFQRACVLSRRRFRRSRGVRQYPPQHHLTARPDRGRQRYPLPRQYLHGPALRGRQDRRAAEDLGRRPSHRPPRLGGPGGRARLPRTLPRIRFLLRGRSRRAPTQRIRPQCIISCSMGLRESSLERPLL